MSRKSLYRRRGLAVIGIMSWLAFAPVVAAQRPELKRPEEAPVEKPPEPVKKKNVKGPRAVGLLQLNSSGKGSLIPVAILIEGKFYDASVYKADPVPMALEGGTVYEVEKSGESQGLFTVTGALHSNNPTSPTPWMGAGSYLLNGAEVAKKTHKAEDKPVGLDSDNDAPPKLTRGKETGAGESSEASQGNSKASSGGSKQPGADASEKDKDQSGKSQGAPSKQGQGPGAQPPEASTGAGTTAQNAGTESSPKGSSSDSSTGTKDDQGNGAQTEYRPTLRRGKPTETAPPDTTDAVKNDAIKTDAQGTSVRAAGATATAGGSSGGAKPAQLVFLPAISDAGGPQPQSYKFFWKEGEEDDRRKQMLALAENEVQAYVAAREKGTIPAKTVVAKSAKASARKAPGKAEPVFENIQFRAYDVWKNNQPVMILTAEARFPVTAATNTAPLEYDVTIAARTDIYGDLRKLYAAVTDKFHLDVKPRLELIDAVDADGDGRGELLFRETSDAGNGYVIYRPTGDTLWKMFDTLGGE